jgi:hypothetical protein
MLEPTKKILSKRESSFNMMISSAVAYATMLFKNHLPGPNLELLRQDFTVDDAEHETLVSSAFDVAQDFVSSYDFASLAKSDDNDSPKVSPLPSVPLSTSCRQIFGVGSEGNQIGEINLT